MIIRARQAKGVTVYELTIDDEEKNLSHGTLQEGDHELFQSFSKSPLVSEKLCGLALLAKRIEEARHVAETLTKIQGGESRVIRNGDHSAN